MGTIHNQQSSIKILQYFVQIESANYYLKIRSLKLNTISNKRNEQMLYLFRDCLDWNFPAHPAAGKGRLQGISSPIRTPPPTFIRHALSQNKI